MTPEPILVAIHGASGRMGSRLIALIGDDPSLKLAAAIVRPGHFPIGEPAGLRDSGVRFDSILRTPASVVIDFSTPEASLDVAKGCVDRRIPLVVGTTGFDPDQRRTLEAAASAIPLLISANFSKGVNLLLRLVADAARALGREADVEIIERHHRFKKDAPSGTALRLAEVVDAAIGPLEKRHGRSGQVGERPRGEIGMHALRVGDNPGEHTVVFGLLGETVELAHRALNRDGFALGALDAARFLAGKPPGLYSLNDLFNARA